MFSEDFPGHFKISFLRKRASLWSIFVREVLVLFPPLMYIALHSLCLIDQQMIQKSEPCLQGFAVSFSTLLLLVNITEFSNFAHLLNFHDYESGQEYKYLYMS